MLKRPPTEPLEPPSLLPKVALAVLCMGFFPIDGGANFLRDFSSSTSPERTVEHIEEDLANQAAGIEEPHRLIGPIGHGPRGVVFEPIYYGEVFSNTKGGITTRDATQYHALLDIALAADFQAMGLPLPGRFFMLAQNTHGRGLTEDFVGDVQVISNIDSFDNIMQVTEYWYEFDILDGDVTFRFGKQDVNTEFAVVDLAVDFIQSSFGITPSFAVPTYPDTSAAAVMMARITDNHTFKVGVFDGLPDGQNWGFSGQDVVFTIMEVETTWTIFDAFPGAMDVGFAAGNAGTDRSGAPVPRFEAWYAQAEQIIYRENLCDDEDDQGLGIFFMYSTAYPRANIEFREHYGAGVVYKGLLPSRDEDLIGAGLSHVKLSVGSGHETVTELFYKAAIRPYLYVQPDVQFISTPGGIQQDSLVVGFRFELAL